MEGLSLHSKEEYNFAYKSYEPAIDDTGRFSVKKNSGTHNDPQKYTYQLITSLFDCVAKVKSIKQIANPENFLDFAENVKQYVKRHPEYDLGKRVSKLSEVLKSVIVPELHFDFAAKSYEPAIDDKGNFTVKENSGTKSDPKELADHLITQLFDCVRKVKMHKQITNPEKFLAYTASLKEYVKQHPELKLKKRVVKLQDALRCAIYPDQTLLHSLSSLSLDATFARKEASEEKKEQPSLAHAAVSVIVTRSQLSQLDTMIFDRLRSLDVSSITQKMLEDFAGESSFLFAACSKGYPEIALNILKKGPSATEINRVDSNESSALAWAVCECGKNRGLEKVALELMKQGADVNAVNKWGITILQYACMTSSEALALRLLQMVSPDNINQVNHTGNTALIFACKNKMVRVARKLLKYGADTDCVNDSGETPLIFAICNELTDLAQILAIQSSSKTLNQKTNRSKDTALLFACYKKMQKVALKLIELGADVTCVNHVASTALIYACAGGLEKVSLALISKMPKESREVVDSAGRQALYYAFQSGLISVVFKLFGNASDLAKLPNKDCLTCRIKDDPNGDTPLIWACRENPQFAFDLLAAHAPHYPVNRYGDTALHVAVRGKELKLVDALIKQGASIHAKNYAGDTPLLAALKSAPHSADNQRMALLLLDNKSDSHVRDQFDNTPFHYAMRHGFVVFAGELLKMLNFEDHFALNLSQDTPYRAFLESSEWRKDFKGMTALLKRIVHELLPDQEIEALAEQIWSEGSSYGLSQYLSAHFLRITKDKEDKNAILHLFKIAFIFQDAPLLHMLMKQLGQEEYEDIFNKLLGVFPESCIKAFLPKLEEFEKSASEILEECLFAYTSLLNEPKYLEQCRAMVESALKKIEDRNYCYTRRMQELRINECREALAANFTRYGAFEYWRLHTRQEGWTVSDRIQLAQAKRWNQLLSILDSGVNGKDIPILMHALKNKLAVERQDLQKFYQAHNEYMSWSKPFALKLSPGVVSSKNDLYLGEGVCRGAVTDLAIRKIHGDDSALIEPSYQARFLQASGAAHHKIASDQLKKTIEGANKRLAEEKNELKRCQIQAELLLTLTKYWKQDKRYLEIAQDLKKLVDLTPIELELVSKKFAEEIAELVKKGVDASNEIEDIHLKKRRVILRDINSDAIDLEYFIDNLETYISKIDKSQGGHVLVNIAKKGEQTGHAIYCHLIPPYEVQDVNVPLCKLQTDDIQTFKIYLLSCFNIYKDSNGYNQVGKITQVVKSL